jgi:HSP20 family protein
MAIVRFNPMNEVMNLQREMDRIVDRFFPVARPDDDAARSAVWRPTVDVHEDENSFVIDAELPGMRKEDVKISFQDGVLSLSGERRYEYEEKEPVAEKPNGNGNGNGEGTVEGRVSVERKTGRSCHRMERFYGRFHRTFTFPTAVNPDTISARFENGILKVVVPKAEQVKPRQIEIG